MLSEKGDIIGSVANVRSEHRELRRGWTRRVEAEKVNRGRGTLTGHRTGAKNAASRNELEGRSAQEGVGRRAGPISQGAARRKVDRSSKAPSAEVKRNSEKIRSRRAENKPDSFEGSFYTNPVALQSHACAIM